MKHLKFLLASVAVAMTACAPQKQAEEPTLKDVFKDKFLIGTAMNTWQVAGLDTAAQNIVKKHFSAIVAENCMKAEEIHPEKDRYNFAAADSLVAFGEANGITVTGHTLIWHSQCPRWFCFDENGELVSPEVLKEHMREHIHTVVGRYKGRIKGWDVVNEAIVEDGSYRKSPFYRILGEEFIPLAFQYAHEADPDAELYLNDYGMNVPGRRDTYVKIIKDLQARGLRIDAIGMQGHMGMDYPSFDEFEESLLAYAGTGIKVMITEWDMSALPTVKQTANISDTVAFKKGETVNYYISQAGGFANGARKSKAFIIYMNGQVAEVNKWSKKQIEPGCEIVVPIKDKTKADKWNIQTILGIASSIGSLGLTAASVANILK